MRYTRHLNTLQSILTILALLATGAWALYRWQLSGGSDWMVNLDMTTEVLPYTKNLRMLVVHVKSKNPTTSAINFDPGLSTYTLSAKTIPADAKENSNINLARVRNLMPPIDLMPNDGTGILYMPNAEFEDTEILIVTANSTVFLSAEIARKEGIRQPSDFVSVERVVQVVDQPQAR
jgi:hypothetical protein